MHMYTYIDKNNINTIHVYDFLKIYTNLDKKDIMFFAPIRSLGSDNNIKSKIYVYYTKNVNKLLKEDNNKYIYYMRKKGPIVTTKILVYNNKYKEIFVYVYTIRKLIGKFINKSWIIFMEKFSIQLLTLISNLLSANNACLAHGAAVASPVPTVLIAHEDFGKTSTLLQLISNGAKVLSDDMIILSDKYIYAYPYHTTLAKHYDIDLSNISIKVNIGNEIKINTLELFNKHFVEKMRTAEIVFIGMKGENKIEKVNKNNYERIISYALNLALRHREPGYALDYSMLLDSCYKHIRNLLSNANEVYLIRSRSAKFVTEAIIKTLDEF